MLKFVKSDRICFIGKSTDLLVFLKHLSATYTKVRDIKKAKYYS